MNSMIIVQIYLEKNGKQSSIHSHQDSHRLQIEIILRVEPAVHGVEGDVDVGDAVEDLGPEGRLVRRLGLAVTTDQRHLGRVFSIRFTFSFSGSHITLGL